MKKGYLFMVVLAVSLMSFTTQSLKKYSTNVEESKVEWKGFKPGGKHFGTVTIKDGTLLANGSQLVSGSFTIDMNSIQVLDSDEPKLVKHLKSADFFEVNAFPTAKFDILGSEIVKGKTQINGYLTIKGIRKKISFRAKVSKNKLGQLVLKSETFKVNRADFNIKFKSKTFYANLKDKFIYDEFEMKVVVISSEN